MSVMSSEASKTKALCVATRCMTAEQFVATFHKFCDESSFFVATLNTRPVGLETPFAIQLADRTPVLRGLCVVLDAWTTPANRFKRPGIRLGIRRLTTDSQEVFARLQTRRAANPGAIEPEEPDAAEATAPDSPKLPESHVPAAAPVPAPGDLLPKPPTISRTRTPHTIPRAQSPVLSTQPLAFVQKLPEPPKLEPAPAKAEPASISSPASPAKAEPTKREAVSVELKKPEPASARTDATLPRQPILRMPATIGSESKPAIKLPDLKPPPDAKSAPTFDTKTPPPIPSVKPADKPPLPSLAEKLAAAPVAVKPVDAKSEGKPTELKPVVTKPFGSRQPFDSKLDPDPVAAQAPPEPPPPEAKPAPAPAPPAPPAPPALPALPAPIEAKKPIELVDRPFSPKPAEAKQALSKPGESDDFSDEERRRASRTPITSLSNSTASGLITLSTLSAPTPGAKPAADAAPPPAAAKKPSPIVDLATYSAISEPSYVGGPPPLEDGRTPGSDLVLPANPLSDLTDDSIEGFVDCTLYESTATFLKAPGEDGDFEDGPAPPPRPSQVMPAFGNSPSYVGPPPQPGQPGTSSSYIGPPPQPGSYVGPAPMPPFHVATPPGMPAYDPRLARPSTLPPWATPPGTPGPDGPVNIRLSTPPPDSVSPPGVMDRFDAPPSYSLSSTMPAVVPDEGGEQQQPPPHGYAPYPTGSYDAINGMQRPTPLPGHQTPLPGHAPLYAAPAGDSQPVRRSMHRWALIAAPIAAASIVAVVLLARASEPAAPKAPPPPPVKMTAPAIDAGVATVARTVIDAGLAGDPEGEGGEGNADPDDTSETPTTSSGVPVVGDGPCLLNVTTTPAGSLVQVDGQSVGPSPITIAGPCQRRRVDISHVRYKAATQWVMVNADKQNTLDVMLTRPTHSLTITTLPPGATIFIGGRRAGTSPTVVQVMGFSGMNLTIEKPGWKPVTKKVYSKTPQDKLFVKLTK